MKLFARLGAGVLGLAMVLTIVTPASAQTIEDLLAQIATLQSQLQALQGGSPAATGCYTFTRNLTIGSQGGDVTALQNYLTGTGHFTFSGGATGYFGPITQSAVAAWQAANGVAPAVGYFGPISMAKYNQLCTPVTPSTPSTPGDDNDDDNGSDDFFSGNDEGFLDDFDQLSKYTVEEVGEGEDDVKVLGVDFDVQDADQMIERVIVEIDTPTGDDDLEDFIEDVSVWLDGEMLGRLDVDEASHNQSADKYTFRFNNLEGLVEEGEESELIAAVTGVGNLDSSDAGATWAIRFPADAIRAVSPNGVFDEYDSSAYATTFSLETFASATGLELKVAESNDSPDSHVVDVDASDDTDNVELLIFTLEAEDSSMNITEIPITLTVTGVADVDLIANRLTLRQENGDEYSETVTTSSVTSATVTFDDLDIDFDENEKIEFTVLADINDLEGTFGDGDTLKAQLTATNRDYIEVEDSSGEDVPDADKSGTALGDEVAFYDAGIYVTFVSASENVATDDGNDDDTGTFTIKYEVEAFDSTIYVSDSATATIVETIPDSTLTGGVRYRVDEAGTATVADLSAIVTFSTSGGASDSGVTNGVELADGESAVFTLTVTRTNNGDADDDGLYRMFLEAITWATTDTGTQNVYDFDLEDYKTDPISIN